MERKTFDYKLKDKDRELLRLADKANALDKLMVNIRYYSKEDEEKMAKKEILDLEEEIETIEELLNKYNFYAPEYFETDNSFHFGKALPMEIFMAFRKDSSKFGFSEFIIEGDDPTLGYRTCKRV